MFLIAQSRPTNTISMVEIIILFAESIFLTYLKKSIVVVSGTSLMRRIFLLPQTVMVFGRFRSNQVTTIRRVTKKAVKTEVRMPIPSVMAKPRTGPEPTM